MNEVNQTTHVKNRSLNPRLIWAVVLIFVGTEMLAVMFNGILANNFVWNRSISRYVGLGLWSSILFALGNFVVSALVGRYLWKVGEVWKMPRGFYYLIVLTVVGLLGLSFCPLGIADHGTEISIISTLHQIFSRLMFFMMLVIAVFLAFSRRTNEGMRVYSMMFVAYGITCAIGSVGMMAWLENAVLIWETLFFVLFMILIAVIPFGKKRSKKTIIDKLVLD